MTQADDPRGQHVHLAGLIEQCEERHWEWKLGSEWEQDGPDSWTWMPFAAVRLSGWDRNPPDQCDDEGWLGICDGEHADLLRVAMETAEGVQRAQARERLRAAVNTRERLRAAVNNWAISRPGVLTPDE